MSMEGVPRLLGPPAARPVRRGDTIGENLSESPSKRERSDDDDELILTFGLLSGGRTATGTRPESAKKFGGGSSS